MVDVIFDDKEVMRALQNLQKSAGDISPALREIGEVLTDSTKQRFSSKTGPDGRQWEDNSPVTIARKGRNAPLMGETGVLNANIFYQLIGDDTLEIGSPMEYAAMQQFGGTKAEFPHLWGDIPARPFLGISDQDQIDILAIIDQHLTDAIK